MDRPRRRARGACNSLACLHMHVHTPFCLAKTAEKMAGLNGSLGGHLRRGSSRASLVCPLRAKGGGPSIPRRDPSPPPFPARGCNALARACQWRPRRWRPATTMHLSCGVCLCVYSACPCDPGIAAWHHANGLMHGTVPKRAFLRNVWAYRTPQFCSVWHVASLWHTKSGVCGHTHGSWESVPREGTAPFAKQKAQRECVLWLSAVHWHAEVCSDGS